MKFADRLALMRVVRPYLAGVSLRYQWRLFHAFRTEGLTRHQGRLWIHSYLPPIPSPAFDRLYRIALSSKRVPYQVYMAISANCPYHCSFCSYGRRHNEQLSTTQTLDIIAQLRAMGTAIFGITGGEPLLRPDLPQIIAAAAPDMSTILFTSGYGLEKAKAQTLQDHGLECVAVGIEAASPQAHDAIRGVQGSFEQAITALRACSEVGIYTAVSTIATRQKIASGELDRLYDLASRHHVHELRVLSPIATGCSAGNQDFMLGSVDLAWVRQFHIHKNLRMNGPVVSSTALIESPQMFGCTAGYHHCYIDAAGNVCPCDLTPLSFGNLTKTSLQDIWEEMGRLFPQPRSRCLMSQIAASIDKDNLPLSSEESHHLIPDSKGEPLPYLYRLLR